MDPQIVYGLAFADMELGDNRAGEGAIRVLEIEAPEELRGLESHVLRALPERVTFLHWSLLCVWQDGRHHRGLLFRGPVSCTPDQGLWWSPPRWSRAGGDENEKFDAYLLVSGLGSIL